MGLALAPARTGSSTDTGMGTDTDTCTGMCVSTGTATGTDADAGTDFERASDCFGHDADLDSIFLGIDPAIRDLKPET